MGREAEAALSVLFTASLAAAVASCSAKSSEHAQGEPRADAGAAGSTSSGGADVDASGVSPDDGGGGDSGGEPKGPLYGFVGSADGKIRAYEVDEASGAWTLKKESAAGTSPSYLAFDPPRRRVVAVDEIAGGVVRSFAFDPATGALTPINQKGSGGAGPTHLSFDRTGAFVLVANYTGGNMSILPIDSAGKLADASDTKASGQKSHGAYTNPSNTHVFVPSLGKDVVAQYALDPASGKLTDNGTAALPPGAGPRHLAFAPDEKHAYTINELAITVTTFDFVKATGKLAAKQTISALPPATPTAGVSGAEIFVHPSGKYVYASTRGENTIAVFTVAAGDGALTLVQNAQTGGDRPRCFGLSPEGTLLYAANQDDGAVVGFRVDATTGNLSPLGKTFDVASPAFVGLVHIP